MKLTYNDYRWLKRAVDMAEQWRGELIGNPDPKPLIDFDQRIQKMRDVLAKIKEGQ